MRPLYPLLLASVFLLPSCVALGIGAGLGAGAAVGVAATQEGGLSRAGSDARIQLEINDLWFKYDVDTLRKLDLTVNHGRVLVTGVVQNPESRVEAIRLAWQPAGVVQVINEVRVADSEGLVGFAKDSWITTRLRTALTFNRDVQSINYSIDTVQGTIYLMGFAQNQEELDNVIEIARTIDGVKGVVSYVKLVGTPDQAALNAYDGQSASQNAYNNAAPLSYEETYQPAAGDDFGYDDQGYNSQTYNPQEYDSQGYNSQEQDSQIYDNSDSAYPSNVNPNATYSGGIEREAL